MRNHLIRSGIWIGRQQSPSLSRSARCDALSDEAIASCVVLARSDAHLDAVLDSHAGPPGRVTDLPAFGRGEDLEGFAQSNPDGTALRPHG